MNRAVPPFVGLSPDAGHPPYGSPGLPGFLSVANAAFRPSGPASADMKLQGISSERLNDRKSLLTRIDRLRREMDTSGTLEGLDALSRQAFNILTDIALVEALDISKEPESVRERYGKGDANRFGDGAPRNLEHFLMAR